MSSKRAPFLIVLIALFALTLPVLPAQAQTPGPARTISLAVDRTILVVGEEIQVRVATRDGNGVRRPPETFVWSSLNPAVMTVDNRGVAVAVGVGISTISATSSNLRATVSMQVVPQRVEVVAPRDKMFVGEEMQLTATAYDVAGGPIPNVTFRWDLTGANGGTTRAASISSTGLLLGVASALVTAKATVVYTGVQANQVTEFSSVTRVLIEPKIDYKLTRVLQSEPVERAFKIQPSYMAMGGNEQGQIAFVAPLDGISSAVMLYDAGKLDVLATAGSPGPQPGSFIWGFENPAINNKGQAVFRVNCAGAYPSSGLMLATREGVSYVVLEGQSLGNMWGLNGMYTTRYSINDNGDILFRANFQYQGNRSGGSGLFKIVNGFLYAVQTSDTPLAGLGPNYTFGFFGLSQNGTVFFTASDGGRSALYRIEEGSEPLKILAIGDSLAGFRVISFTSWTGFGISPNGMVGFHVGLSNGTTGIVRLRAGASQLETAFPPNGVTDVFAVSRNGDLLFTGGDEHGWGLHFWGGQTSTNSFSPVLINNVPIEGGNIWTYFDAFISKTGEVISHLITANNDLVVVRGSGQTIAFKAGTTVNVKANFNFLNVVPGARGDAPPVVLTGGPDTSVMQWSAQGAVPLYTTGQRTASDPNSPWNLTNAVRNSSGDLYFTNSAGLSRNVAGRTEALQRTQTNVASSSTALSFYKIQWFQGYYNGANTLAVNSRGAAVSLAQSDQGSVVLYVDGQNTAVIAAMGGNAPTPTPAGGFFSNWIWGAALAIDDAGRVMFGAFDRNGRQGLYIYENRTWRTAALANSTTIDGRTVTNVTYLQSANNKFYAQFGMGGGEPVIAEYVSDGTWKRLVGRGDIVPNGGEVNFVLSRFDINRNGDMAFLVNMNSGQAVMVRLADGTNHFVYLTSDPEIQGDRLTQFGNTGFDLRDDRRLYFTAVDLFDRNVLLLAEPQF